MPGLQALAIGKGLATTSAQIDSSHELQPLTPTKTNVRSYATTSDLEKCALDETQATIIHHHDMPVAIPSHGREILINTIFLLTSIVTLVLTIAIALLTLFIVGQARDMIRDAFIPIFSVITGICLFLFACTLFVCWLDERDFFTATEKALMAIEQAVAVAILFTVGIQIAGLILESVRDGMA